MSIHITGASGAGTSTLGRAISEKYGYTHLDTDDFFWLVTDPPFTTKRPPQERLRLMSAAMDKTPKCVISGSLTDWGDALIPRFDLVVYVHTPTAIRLERLQAREYRHFGARIEPGGDMADEHQTFLAWAAMYDDGGLDMRSAAHHSAWLEKIPCPIIYVDGTKPVQENMMLLGI